MRRLKLFLIASLLATSLLAVGNGLKTLAWAPDCNSANGAYLNATAGRCVNVGFFSGVSGTKSDPGGVPPDKATGGLDQQYKYPAVVPFSSGDYWWAPSACVNQAAITDAANRGVPSGSWPACQQDPNYADKFIAEISANLNGDWNCREPGSGLPLNNPYPSCSATRRLAINSALIIATMLGQKGPTFQDNNNPAGSYFNAIPWAKNPANFNKWAALVKSYAAAGQVNWADGTFLDKGHLNSTPINQSTDYVFFNWDQDPYPASLITFTDASGKPLWQMNRSCGNLVGVVNGLTTIQPSGFTAQPQPAQPVLQDANGKTETEAPVQAQFAGGVYVTITGSGNGVQATATRRYYYLKNGSTNQNFINGAGDTYSQVYKTGTNALPLKTIRAGFPANLQPGDQVCEEIQVSPSNGQVAPNGTVLSGGTSSTTLSSCSPVVGKPYLQALGGDVLTGGGMPRVDTSGPKPQIASCDTNASARIISWNRDNANNVGYSGAGAEYAVRSMLDVIGFRSHSIVTGGPTDLTFANTTNNQPDQDKFGGNFGSAPACPSGNDSIIQNALAGGPGSQLTSASQIPGSLSNGAKLTLYSTQDVYIDHDIIYAGANPGSPGYTPWLNIGDIPSFRLVVLGANIYIAPNVHELDGLYYAAPAADGSKGEIVTCATGKPGVLGSGAAVPADPGLYGACTSKLDVYGSLMAKHIQFLRTSGTLHNSATPGNAAETVHYSPELWMVRPQTSNSGTSSTYDSMSSLPPVL